MYTFLLIIENNGESSPEKKRAQCSPKHFAINENWPQNLLILFIFLTKNLQNIRPGTQCRYYVRISSLLAFDSITVRPQQEDPADS